jgi:hypothetical protein
MAPHRRRTRVPLALLAVLVLAALLVAACSAQASGGSSSGTAASSDGASASAAAGGDSGSATEAAAGAKGETMGDWERVLAALAYMRAETPAKPVVVLLGGSAARESTTSDSSWRSQIVAEGGPETLAWNMGSRNRTMAQNLAIVKKLPKVPTVIYVGINLGSFTSTQKSASIALPSPAPGADEIPLQQYHAYKAPKILSTAKKKTLVRAWMAERYPVYKANFSRNAGLLEQILKYCATVEDGSGTRLFRPVLLELPRDSAVIGSALNAPTTKYRDKCKQLAAKYKVKWVPQLASLPNSSYYDLWHLVEPGRKVWQGKLSEKTAALLKLYGYDGGGS